MIDRFLAGTPCPIVEGARCTFLYRGEADGVYLVHRSVGLPDPIGLRRLHGTDLWYVVIELPEGSRFEYQLEVARGEQRERINDPLNPLLAHSPVGELIGLPCARVRGARMDQARSRGAARVADRPGGAQPCAAP